jgi:ribonuclease P protein subunit POP4
MRITPNIINGEFIGTNSEVSNSRHKAYVGIKGEIIDETKNTFTLMQNGKAKSVIKEQVVFNFKFSDGTIVEINGKLLVGRPEDRLKKSIKRLW